MNTLKSVLFATTISLLLFSCKNEKSGENIATGEENIALKVDNSKVLAGIGATDISNTHHLNQSQIVQEGNIGFIFSSLNALKLYVESSQVDSNIDFANNVVWSLFGEKTTKETIFKVENIDFSSTAPILNVTKIVGEKVVSEYRPSLILNFPKKGSNEIPIIKVDGKDIPVMGMQ